MDPRNPVLRTGPLAPARALPLGCSPHRAAIRRQRAIDESQRLQRRRPDAGQRLPQRRVQRPSDAQRPRPGTAVPRRSAPGPRLPDPRQGPPHCEGRRQSRTARPGPPASPPPPGSSPSPTACNRASSAAAFLIPFPPPPASCPSTRAATRSPGLFLPLPVRHALPLDPRQDHDLPQHPAQQLRRGIGRRQRRRLRRTGEPVRDVARDRHAGRLGARADALPFMVGHRHGALPAFSLGSPHRPLSPCCR